MTRTATSICLHYILKKKAYSLRVVNPHYVEGYFSDVCVEGGKITLQVVSASRLARNKIPTANPMFSGPKFSMVLKVTLPYETGSQKSKMAAEIMQLHASQLIYMKAAQFKRQ